MLYRIHESNGYTKHESISKFDIKWIFDRYTRPYSKIQELLTTTCMTLIKFYL